MAEDFQEKTEKASTRKLEEARKRGQVAKSQEITTMTIFFFQILIIYILRKRLWTQFCTLFITSYRLLNEPIEEIEAISYWIKQWISCGISILYPMLLVAFIVGLVVNIFQVGFHISLHPLVPNLERLNIFLPKNYQRFFNSQAVMRSILGSTKIAAIFLLSYQVINFFLPDYARVLMREIDVIIPFIFYTAFWLLVICALLLFLISIADVCYQRWKFSEEMKMSKQELKEEHKQMEGDPKMKARFRSFMQEMIRGRLKSNVPKASVVIANPTHYAVALRYEAETMETPICVAKGMHRIAIQIKEIAKQQKIPIVENPPLARSLYRVINIGQFIPAEFYHAVAESLAYVYQLNEQNKKVE